MARKKKSGMQPQPVSLGMERIPDEEIRRTGHNSCINPDDIVAEYHGTGVQVFIVNTWIKQQTPETLQKVKENIEDVCGRIMANAARRNGAG